jgi:hypothetical protein
MRTSLLLVVCLAAVSGFAQQETKDLDKAGGLSVVEPSDAAGIRDRAGGTHNKSNVGFFFENRGKLYPRRDADGPDCVWPIGSGRKYGYRMNPFIGIPDNVVQGRWTTNEEWEAVGGYHNPALAKVAFSDDPTTWPATGWPVKDANGEPLIRSDQDSYCVYADSNNQRGMLGLVVAQTGYAYSTKLVRDMVFFKFAVTNISSKTLEKVYFSYYADCDVGNVAGGDPEWQDDRVGFNEDARLLYFYDADGYSSEWPGAPPGYVGVVFLRTPTVGGVERGVTDVHYFIGDDEVDVDSVQYGIMSSDVNLYNSSIGSRFFHPGPNSTDLHFDDMDTQPAAGLDAVAMMSSGPYTLNPGDTLVFETAVVLGQTLAEILANTRAAQQVADFDYTVARPPERPNLTAVPGNGKVTLTWDNSAEISRDRFSNRFDFEGYRLYKSLDRGATWDQIDRNASPSTGPDPVPLAKFDKINGLGDDTGLQYSYVDSGLVNGFEYWYGLTAYDQGDSTIESLECGLGASVDVPNVVSAVPGQSPIGVAFATATAPTQSGSGNSNDVISAVPADPVSRTARTYTMSFAPIALQAQGDMSSSVTAAVANLAQTTSRSYGLRFSAPGIFDVFRLAPVETLLVNQTYTSGSPVTFDGLEVVITDPPGVPAALLPDAGDSVVVSRGIRITSGNDTVLSLRPLSLSKPFATSDGLVLQVTPASYVKSIVRTAGSGLTVSAAAQTPAAVVDETYRMSVTGTVTVGTTVRINVEVRNSAGTVVASRDSAASGQTLDFGGIRATMTFLSSSPPAVNTAVEIVTQIPRTSTYRDQFTFSTTAAATNPEQVKNELSNVKVVPNPYVVGSRFEEEFGALRREPIRQLKFIHLPPECDIHIFTLDGDLVQTIRHSDGTGVATWDLRTAGGREIAAGVYFYLLKTDGAERLSRFAVIK